MKDKMIQPNKTTQVVREAMHIVSRDVRAPKAVRQGHVTANANVSSTKKK